MARPEFLGISWFTWTYLAGFATMIATNVLSDDIKGYVDPRYPMSLGVGLFSGGFVTALYQLSLDKKMNK